jgi:arylsulfatase A-like enzyme
VPVPAEVQGTDLSSLARGVDGPRQTEVLIQWLGAALHGFCDFEYRGIRSEKYLYCVGTQPHLCLLFDNEADPWQMSNLFEDPSAEALRAELHDRLCAAILRSGEQVPQFIRDRRPTGRRGEP